MECLESFSPLVEQVSIDEAFIDLTGTSLVDGSVEKTAIAIKEKILSKTSLTCSVGVSTSKLVAKIASDMNKPDGLTIVPPDRVISFLSKLPVGKVPGIGEKSIERLKKIGVEFVGDLRKFPDGELANRFGKFGEWLEQIAYGVDDSPVEPYREPRSISAERTLPKDTSDLEILKRELLELSEKVGRRIRSEGFRCRTVVLKIRLADLKRLTRRKTLARPTGSGEVIFKEAYSLLRDFPLKKKVRLIGVGVTSLEPAGDFQRQTGLFESIDPLEEKWEKAERAIDKIIEKFGEDALKRGTLKEK